MDPAFSYLTDRACNSCLIIVYKATLAEKSSFVTVREVFKAMPRTGMGLLNTWVSHNKRALIGQFDRCLLCAAYRKI